MSGEEAARPPDFDRIARPYRWLEYLTLGPILQNCRTHYLAHLNDQRQAMILGDGDGRFTARLLQANPYVHAVAIDTSAAMLALLRDRCEKTVPGASCRLGTVQQSALDATPSDSTDLIVSHFFLDCLTQPELESLITCVTSSLSPGTLWLISDFRIPANALRLPARLLIRSLYFVFRLLTGLRTTRLPDYATPLTMIGFTRIASRAALGGMLVTELWRKMELKAL